MTGVFAWPTSKNEMSAYYNEIDPFAAQWLRNLISAGLIAPGEVDTRSIEDVRPDDLRGFTQCHFFAGIGVWSHALRQAGWADDRSVWTGSCPCQPFSTAGKGGGFTDERHLWPAFHHLIAECRPSVVFGEQVASADGLAWFDLVQADLENTGYAAAAIDLCAAGVGAPHIRQRLFWVGHADDSGLEGYAGDGDSEPKPGWHYAAEAGPVTAPGISMGGVGVADSDRFEAGLQTAEATRQGRAADADGRTSGFWADADWLPFLDGKWRAVEPGSFPVAYGSPGSVGRLRAYGNAIVAPLATEFIAAFMQTQGA